MFISFYRKQEVERVVISLLSLTVVVMINKAVIIIILVVVVAHCYSNGSLIYLFIYESQGCPGERFFHHFDQSVVKRADQIGLPLAALVIYWSQQLSLTFATERDPDDQL